MGGGGGGVMGVCGTQRENRLGWQQNWLLLCLQGYAAFWFQCPPKFDIVDEIKKYIYHGYVAATAVQTSHY